MFNYHRHSDLTQMTLPDSTASLEEYAKRTVELGQTCLSSCEHGNAGLQHNVFDVAQAHGLHAKKVAELYFVPDRFEKDRRNFHLIVAAKTKKGQEDLNEMISEANISGFYYRPRVDFEILSRYSPEDIFVTTACIGGVWSSAFKKMEDGNTQIDFTEADRLVKMLHDHFRDSFMLEVQAHHVERQKEVNRHILSLYRKEGIPLIAAMDSHYIYDCDKVKRDEYLKSKHIDYPEENGFYLDYPDSETFFNRFKEQGVLPDVLIREAMENTDIFDSFEDMFFTTEKKIPTIYPDLGQDDRNEKYREVIRRKWREYRKDVPKEEWPLHESEIAKEVDTITSTNMSDYFLLANRWVEHYKERGGAYTYTGRGSGPSFFSNTLIGASSIDRVTAPLTMYPERFISANRIRSGSLPDLDSNIGDQALAAQCLEDVVGKNHSFEMIALGKVKLLSGFKLYCRAANVPFEIANQLSDSLKKYEKDCEYQEDDAVPLDVYDYIPPEYKEIFDMSQEYMGIVDNVSPHPCAWLLSNKDIRREIGVIRIVPKQGKKEPVFCALIEGSQADKYGYLKMDLLAVDVVKVNADIFHRLGIPQPTVPELIRLTEDDRSTWSMYSKGLTMGLNQVEREKSREKVMQYKPRNITELSAFVAAIRPGFKSMVDVFLNRKHFDYGIPALDKLIQTPQITSSFILFQENVMAILQYAGFTAEDSYMAIKAIAKKKAEKVLALKENFIPGFRDRLIEEAHSTENEAVATAEKVWQIIEDNCKYSFNSSHAYAVALDSLYTAYAKAHYPFETYVALLSNYAEKGDKDRINLAKIEMRKGFGIRIVPCKFRQDNRGFYIDKEAKTISDALMSVKHISKKVAEALYAMRNNQYDSFVDLLYDMEMHPAFDSRNVEILIRMGYFEEFGSSGKLLRIQREFRDGEIKFSKSHVEATQQKRLALLREFAASLPEEEIPMAEQLAFETEHYGAPISEYPDRNGYCTVLEVDEKYSPKLRLYNVARGTVGIMKVRKPQFTKNPLAVGDTLYLYDWKKKPAYQYVDGKSRVKPGVYELWMTSWEKVPVIS